MKHIFLLILLMCCFCFIQAQAVIERIVLSTDNPIVTRTVITLSEKTTWTYETNKNNHTLKINIKDCDAGNPSVTGLGKSNLVADIDLMNNQSNCSVTLTLKGSFILEPMSLEAPYRIVLDLFVYRKNYSFAEHLLQTEFYEKSGLYNKANKQFTIMERDYPDNEDLYYYWGKLLINQKRPENAKVKLKQVQESSRFYQSAQNLLASLDKKEEIKAQLVDVSTALAIAESEQETLKVPRKIPTSVNKEGIKIRFFSFRTFFGMSWAEFMQTKFMSALRSLPFWFWLIIFVILLLLVLVFIDVRRNLKRKKVVFKSPKAETPNELRKRMIKSNHENESVTPEAESKKDSRFNLKVKKREKTTFTPQAETKNSFMQDMVNKLLENGWGDKEIARELNLSPKEAQALIKKGKKQLSGKKK